MKKVVLVVTAIFTVLLGAIAVGAAVHFRRVNLFVNEVSQAFSGNPEDVKLVRAVGYPNGFLSAKIESGEFKDRSDASRFLKCYHRMTVHANEKGTQETYVFRVGLLPADDPVILEYDRTGKLLGMPVDGLSWR